MDRCCVEVVTGKNLITSKMKHTKILFEHDNALEGGYGIESAWAIPIGEHFQLDNILFYAKEFALGDIVNTEIRDGDRFVIGLVKESGHSTIRMLFENEDEISETRKQLSKLGCDSEISNIPTLIAVDIPPNVEYTAIRSYLELGEQEGKWSYEEACIAQ